MYWGYFLSNTGNQTKKWGKEETFDYVNILNTTTKTKQNQKAKNRLQKTSEAHTSEK